MEIGNRSQFESLPVEDYIEDRNMMSTPRSVLELRERAKLPRRVADRRTERIWYIPNGLRKGWMMFDDKIVARTVIANSIVRPKRGSGGIKR